jgi:hypothetical protein
VRPRRVYQDVRRAWRLIPIVVALLVAVATPASAKVLPYQLNVSPTTTSIGERITITMELDPQNVLGESFDFEIAVFRPSALGPTGRPSRNAKPVRRVLMTRTGDSHVYEGVFTPARRGQYVVVGMSGLHEPVPITISARPK